MLNSSLHTIHSESLLESLECHKSVSLANNVKSTVEYQKMLDYLHKLETVTAQELTIEGHLT